MVQFTPCLILSHSPHPSPEQYVSLHAAFVCCEPKTMTWENESWCGLCFAARQLLVFACLGNSRREIVRLSCSLHSWHNHCYLHGSEYFFFYFIIFFIRLECRAICIEFFLTTVLCIGEYEGCPEAASYVQRDFDTKILHAVCQTLRYPFPAVAFTSSFGCLHSLGVLDWSWPATAFG